MKRTFYIATYLMLSTSSAFAQSMDIGRILSMGGGETSGRIMQMVLLITILSIAPGLLIMVTSFTRFAVALSFLRVGLGLQSTPANLVLISLSLFMTFFVMGPVFDKAWETGAKPLLERKITEEDAFKKIAEPFRDFMKSHVRERDLALFVDLASCRMQAPADSGRVAPNAVDSSEFRILIPAFMISELRRGFEIGFLIILPFLVIDMIVATVTMSMGMMMMPPSVIALPIKVLFFVLFDGWNMLVGSLVRSMN